MHRVGVGVGVGVRVRLRLRLRGRSRLRLRAGVRMRAGYLPDAYIYIYTFQMQRVAPSRSGTSCPRSSAGATWVVEVCT
jgi:hypothetical protein